MATPSAKRKQNQPQPEDIDPRWLLKAFAAVIVGAVVCAYLAVCLLVYLGSWQLMLHPSASVDRTPSIPFEAIRFDAAETGQPRLAGWWIPTGSPAAPTILFLHDGAGSLSQTVPTLELLHRAQVNIFAIDYRGFGQSDGPHPTESRMGEDAAAALGYLTDTRHIPPAGIVAYGQGLGAVLAANLAASHAELPAVTIEDPDTEAYARAVHDPRTRLLPMRLLMRERFNIAAALATVRQPKLLMADSPYTLVPFHAVPERIAANQAMFRAVSDPKFTITFDNTVFRGALNTADSEDSYIHAVNRFCDDYVAAPIPALKSMP